MKRKLLPLGLLVFFLTSCAKKSPQNVFRPEGEQADRINGLQVPVFIAAGVVGVIVFLMVAFVVVKYRRKDGDDDTPDPAQIHGNLRLEMGWTIVPFLILLPISIFTVARILDLTDEPKDAMHISVYGQQWWWSYEYDLDGDGEPEIVTANDLVIPTGEKIVLDISSRDVIHSYWIPALAGTADAVPGRNHELIVEAAHPGVYVGQCKEFCGLSHANMRARAVALTKDEFETWLDQQQEPAAMPDQDTDPVAYEGMQIFLAKCASCHQIDGLEDANGNPLDVEGNAALVSKHAPNLTHLMSRGVFASGEFDLYYENPATGKIELNRPALEAWLRDPPGELPMAPDEARGMPNLQLTDPEIDALVAFLATLGPAPPGNG